MIERFAAKYSFTATANVGWVIFVTVTGLVLACLSEVVALFASREEIFMRSSYLWAFVWGLTPYVAPVALFYSLRGVYIEREEPSSAVNAFYATAIVVACHFVGALVVAAFGEWIFGSANVSRAPDKTFVGFFETAAFTYGSLIVLVAIGAAVVMMIRRRTRA